MVLVFVSYRLWYQTGVMAIFFILDVIVWLIFKMKKMYTIFLMDQTNMLK